MNDLKLQLHRLVLGMGALLAAALYFTGCGMDDPDAPDQRNSELTSLFIVGQIGRAHV